MGAIYMIRCLVNWKAYIGQSINYRRRWADHLLQFQNDENTKHLYNSMRKHGIENFVFVVLFRCNDEDMNFHEKRFISAFSTINRKYGYNLTSGGDSNYRVSEEIREKMRKTDWRLMIDRLLVFCKKHDSLPLTKGVREDGEESKLATFVINLRSLHKCDNLCDSYVDMINESELSHWFTLEAYNGTHVRKIKDLKAFVEEHGEFPHNRGIRPNEHGLHHYLGYLRQAKKNKRLSPEVDTLVEKTFGESLSWDPILEQRERTLQKIKKFIEEHGDEPKQKGTRSDEERALGTYLSQRRNDKKIKNISDEVVSHIERVLPEFNWNTQYIHALKPVRGGRGYDPKDYNTWSKEQLVNAFKERGIPGGTHGNKMKLIGILQDRDKRSTPSP